MTVTPKHEEVSAGDAVTERLESWRVTDRSFGDVRAVEMLQAMKERADLLVMEQAAELEAYRLRSTELETELAELRIRLQKTRESADALRAELHQPPPPASEGSTSLWTTLCSLLRRR